MDYQEIEYELLGPIARIWHNRPLVRNAESQRLLDEMDDAVRAAVDDTNVRVIVLAGKGEHFSAGHDLKEAQAKRSTFTVEQRYAYEERRYFEYCLRIWDAPKPTIAQVQGACVAGAFMVANMCDLIVASDDAFFADPVVHTLGAASVEVLIHPWVLGMRRAKEMLFTGERVSAEEAWRLGMVNRIVPRTDLDQAVLTLANRIAQSPPFALKILKKSMHTTADIVGLRAALTAHFDTHQLSHVSSEFVQIRDRGLAGAIQKGGPRSGQ